MSPFSAVTGNRKGLRNLQIREDRQPSDENGKFVSFNFHIQEHMTKGSFHTL